ncbi:MAG: right-handed parallel beta-helix repeat-containing protein [Candidatus Hodarchaeota archaeon]
MRDENGLLLISLVILFFLVCSWGQLLPYSSEERHENPALKLDSIDRSITQEYTFHSPITVNNDFELYFFAISGSGSVNDPYILAGWNITGSFDYGIFIHGTTKHFRIENCWIDSSNYHGIFVDNCAAGTTVITNNICNNNGKNGICLKSSGSSIITNNTCYNNNKSGIFIDSSGSLNLANNTCDNNRGVGIDLYYSNSSILAKNICNSNDMFGIGLFSSSSSTLTSNTCNSNVRGGFWLMGSNFSTIVNNTFYNDGIFFWFESSKEELLSYTVENNTVNGLPLGYLKNQAYSSIAKGYGQLILINCSNMVVKNQIYSNISVGVALYYCYDSKLINITCNKNSECGIFLGHSDSSLLTGNICSNSTDGDGIHLYSSSSSNLTNNICYNNNWTGIHLAFSNSSILTTNICNSNGEGGILLSASSYSTITNNTCNNNNYFGIYSDSSYSSISNNTCNNNNGTGIYLPSSSSSILNANICNNNFYGIQLQDSSFLSIIKNTISNNEGYGISIFGSSWNSNISGNIFIGNNPQGTSQAYDDGGNNEFDNNYWDDWTEPDADGDGFVDAPYSIDGNALNEDIYPRVSPSPHSKPISDIKIITGISLFVIFFSVLVISLIIRKRE